MTEQEKIETLTAYTTNLLQLLMASGTINNEGHADGCSCRKCAYDRQFQKLYEALKDNEDFFKTEQAEWRERLVKADESHAAQIERLQTEAAEIKSKLAELPEPKEVDEVVNR